MTCREFADFMADYLDGALTADTMSLFEHHLALCVNCQRYLNGYRATVKLGKSAFATTPGHEVPGDVPEELVKAILAARAAAR